MQVFFVCMRRCFGKIGNIARVASVFSTESENIIIVNNTLSFRACT